MRLLTLCSLTMSLLFSACHSSDSEHKASHEPAGSPVQATDTTLVGKRLHLHFPTNSSTVEYISDDHLFWSSRDSVHGHKESEDTYHAVRIDSSVFFVNWVEADGTTVSQVLDLKARTCQAFITSNVYSRDRTLRSTSVLSGSIEKIEDANHLLLE
ncbi:MoaF-related domain-containing protein [Porphyromonas sp.]